VTVILWLIEIQACGVERFHLGVGRASRRWHRARRGQLLGTVIPHALREASPPGALGVAVIVAPFIALAMTTVSATRRLSAGHTLTLDAAVELTAIATAADRKQRPAERANLESVIGHALARADFLPWSSSRARLHPSMRPRSTWKARSSNSWPSSFRRVTSPS
jgi:hypothetical protein